LDCDFTDSNEKEIKDRMAFGGSSGIFYANKSFPESTTNFSFTYEELDNVLDAGGNVAEYPKVDDIIINE